MIVFALLALIVGVNSYFPPGKDALLSDIFLREVFNRMGKDINENGYYDFPEGRLGHLDARSLNGDLEDEQLFSINYNRLGSVGIHPSLRDQESLQHSSLWGSQLMSGGAGEGKQHLRPEGNIKNKQEIKTDATLPAYCNPPNPCPLGYRAEQGCLEDFENTASFSRKYQGAQDCMCDSEHMFSCPGPVVSSGSDDSEMDPLTDFELNDFLQRALQVGEHKIVAKKYFLGKTSKANPYLIGERLPVAAKKGNNVVF